jgi:SAM-dependent MidA family methyltransferase
MEAILKKQILNSTHGYITYAEFIDTVLYHPELGYYMKEGQKIGREGDFFTTSNVSAIYGSMVAKWYHQLVEKYGLPANICEIGAGTGRFAKTFIDEWNLISTTPLTYTIIETSPYHRRLQQDTIGMNDHIKQIKSLDEIKPFDGLIFSNELFDALPVHVIQMLGNELYEIMVTLNDDTLIEQPVKLANDDILNYLTEQEVVIQEGQRLEVPLSMISLIDSISNASRKALVVTVDYGYSNDEWMDPLHKDGSLRGYYKHQLIHNVLKYPGDMDITSHIHFDALIHFGKKQGLSFIQRLRQDEFFLAIGILKELQDNFDPNPFSEISKRNRAIRSLISPSGISSAFQVILQQKGLDEIDSFFIDEKW